MPFSMYFRMTDGEYCSSFCGKKGKSKDGLSRQKSAKYKNLEGCTSSSSKSNDNSGNIFKIDNYINLINQSCKSFEKDTCSEESVRETSRFTFLKLLERKIKKGFLKSRSCTLVRKSKVDKFYIKYFACVVSIASEYFLQLPFQSSVLLATRLAHKIGSCKKNFDSNMASESKCTASILNENKKAALQYHRINKEQKAHFFDLFDAAATRRNAHAPTAATLLARSSQPE